MNTTIADNKDVAIAVEVLLNEYDVTIPSTWRGYEDLREVVAGELQSELQQTYDERGEDEDLAAVAERHGRRLIGLVPELIREHGPEPIEDRVQRIVDEARSDLSDLGDAVLVHEVFNVRWGAKVVLVRIEYTSRCECGQEVRLEGEVTVFDESGNAVTEWSHQHGCGAITYPPESHVYVDDPLDPASDDAIEACVSKLIEERNAVVNDGEQEREDRLQLLEASWPERPFYVVGDPEDEDPEQYDREEYAIELVRVDAWLRLAAQTYPEWVHEFPRVPAIGPGFLDTSGLDEFPSGWRFDHADDVARARDYLGADRVRDLARPFASLESDGSLPVRP